jgi:hypothetical protein
MDMEKQTIESDKVTQEDVISAFKDGKGWARFEDYVVLRKSELRSQYDTAGDTILGVETLEIYLAANEKDFVMLELEKVEKMINEDRSLPAEVRDDLIKRFAAVSAQLAQ